MVLDGNRNVLYSQRFHRIMYSSILYESKTVCTIIKDRQCSIPKHKAKSDGKPLFTESVEEVRSNLMICATKWPRNH